MKKQLSILICLLLLGSLFMTVSADHIAPKITLQPQNHQYPQYSTAMYIVKASGSNLSATWYLEYEGKTYNISDMTNSTEPWEAYAGETYGPVQLDANTFSCHFGGIEEGLNGAQIWCVIEDGHNDVTSDRAIITVQGSAMPPEITNMPAEITAYRGDSVDIRCVAKSTDGSQLEYTWYESFSGKLQDIRAIDPEETSDFITVSTESTGVRYYVCGITTSAGGRAYSSVLPVTVVDSQPNPDMEILTKTLPDGVVGQDYSAELKCNDPYGLFTVYYNPGSANQLEESGLRLIKENYIVGTPAKAGTFTFTVCASGDYGEDYMTYTLTIKEAEVVPEVTEPEITEPEETLPEETLPEATAPSEPEDETTTEQTETLTTGETPEDSKVQKDKEESRTDDKKTEKQEFPWWGYVLMGIACAAAGAGVTVLLLKKKK